MTAITLRFRDSTIKLTNPGPEAAIEIDLKPQTIELFRTSLTDSDNPFDYSDEGIPADRPAPPRFTDNGDGTVTDHQLDLIWSKATINAKGVKHKAAEKLCAELDLAGHTDWRLPTRAELLSLVDDTRYNPAIDTDVFPDTKSDWYWTSTASASSSDYAWFVLFDYGHSLHLLRDGSYGFVRAVRVVGSPGQSL